MAQSWNPESYARNARFVSDLGEGLLSLLAPQKDEFVLDLGCGDGALTEKLAAAGCRVIAVDSSPEQVAAARARGIDARVCHAEEMPFDGIFDAVLSNAVLHWIPDAGAVLRSVRRALKPGGRFVAEMGGAGNVSAIRAALAAALVRRGIDAAGLDPWIFPTPDEYRRHLEAAGFEVLMIERFPRPTVLPGSLGNWLETFAQPLLTPVFGYTRSRILADVSDALRAQLFRDGKWTADYVRLRFAARATSF